jgi:hypothetical protein
MIVKITTTDNKELLINTEHLIKVFQEDSVCFICLSNGDEIETETTLDDLQKLLNDRF